MSILSVISFFFAILQSILQWISKLFIWKSKPAPQFQCYKLPSLVQEQIVLFMDQNDIILGSLASRNFQVFVERARTKLSLVWMLEKQTFDNLDASDEIHEAFEKPPPTIAFSSDWPWKTFRIRFCWLDQKKSIDRLLRGKTRVRLNEDLEMAVVGLNIVIYNSNPVYSKLADYGFILDVLLGTFIVEELVVGKNSSHVCYHTYIMSTETMYPLALRYRNSVQHINLSQIWKPNVCTDLTSDELSALLDNLEAQEITMDMGTAPGVKYTGILKTKLMRITKASWLTIDNILAMECEKLMAHCVKLTAEELKSFARKWLGGGFAKLKYLSLTNFDKELDWFSVIDEFEGTDIPDYVNYRKKVRRGDGKVAVVAAGLCCFRLIVSE